MMVATRRKPARTGFMGAFPFNEMDAGFRRWVASADKSLMRRESWLSWGHLLENLIRF